MSGINILAWPAKLTKQLFSTPVTVCSEAEEPQSSIQLHHQITDGYVSYDNELQYSHTQIDIFEPMTGAIYKYKTEITIEDHFGVLASHMYSALNWLA